MGLKNIGKHGDNMWFKITISKETEVKGKIKTIQEVYLSDTDNFAEAGYNVMQHLNGECEVESVQLLKTLKPMANEKYAETNKLFIVKMAEDFVQDDGSVKVMKYPVPFYADDNASLQKIVDDYMKQGFQDMRITTISETQWEVV